MTLTLQQWHQRYQQQARWTRNLREYVYNKVSIRQVKRILDVGCGTGVILDELSHISSFRLYGLDINLNSLLLTKEKLPASFETQGDALFLPYACGSFDISLFHFVLLWIKDPSIGLQEMIRVTKHDGFVCALAEPDYGGRIDFPTELSQLGIWQAEALENQGANPNTGRELRALFSDAGLQEVEAGVLGGQWVEITPSDDFDLEWKVIESDLQAKPEFIQSANILKSLELRSREKHHRVLYVPTFYAFGKVKK